MNDFLGKDSFSAKILSVKKASQLVYTDLFEKNTYHLPRF